MRASSSRRLRSCVTVAPPLTGGLEVLDVRAQLEDLLLEAVLLRLEVERRVHERRALLGRVADARSLGCELGRDQEPEAEERKAERDLPGGDRPDAGDDLAHGTADRRRATTMPTITTTTTPPSASSRSGCIGAGVSDVTRLPGRRRSCRAARAGLAVPRRRARAGPGDRGVPAGRDRPGRIGDRPELHRRLGAQLIQPAGLERLDVAAERLGERLVVGQARPRRRRRARTARARRRCAPGGRWRTRPRHRRGTSSRGRSGTGP